MKNAEALAHFRQLSCLGLDSQLVIPAMLTALHDIIPSAINVFYWTDRHGTPVNIYAPEVIPSVLDVLTNGYHLLQGPGEPTIERLAAGPLIAGNMGRFFQTASFTDTAMHSLIYKPYRVGPSLEMTVKAGGEPKGMVFLSRDLGARSFSAKETWLVATLSSYFLHALNATVAPTFASDLRETGDEAALICDARGEVVQASPSAWRMLLFATQPKIAPHAPVPQPGMMLPPQIQRLCRNLSDIRAGRPAPAPMVLLTNAWGGFRFQAHALQSGMSADPSSNPLVVITMRREEPFQLRLMDRLKVMPLSSKQRQIAFRLGMGDGPDEVVRNLDISRETYRTYVKQMYSRLEINNRAALVELLVA